MFLCALKYRDGQMSSRLQLNHEKIARALVQIAKWRERPEGMEPIRGPSGSGAQRGCLDSKLEASKCSAFWVQASSVTSGVRADFVMYSLLCDQAAAWDGVHAKKVWRCGVWNNANIYLFDTVSYYASNESCCLASGHCMPLEYAHWKFHKGSE